MSYVVLVMGNAGSGKTTTASKLAVLLKGVHINGDEVRNSSISMDLDFSVGDRMMQASRIGAIADIVARSGIPAIADFICPTVGTRYCFFNQLSNKSKALLVWMNTIGQGRFDDTNAMFKPPINWFNSPCFFEIKHVMNKGELDQVASNLAEMIRREVNG